MPFVQDFLVIRARDLAADTPGLGDVTLRFNLGNASQDHHAILNFDVQGLCAPGSNPQISVNGKVVSEIDRLYMRIHGVCGDVRFWMPHSIVLPRGVLRLGSNSMGIGSQTAGEDPIGLPDMRMRNIVLYYRTEIGPHFRSVA